MKFISINKYKVVEIVKPKSVYVKNLELSVNDILEFKLRLITNGYEKTSFALGYSGSVTAHNLMNGKTKKFSQGELNVFFGDSRNVVILEKI